MALVNQKNYLRLTKFIDDIEKERGIIADEVFDANTSCSYRIQLNDFKAIFTIRYPTNEYPDLIFTLSKHFNEVTEIFDVPDYVVEYMQHLVQKVIEFCTRLPILCPGGEVGYELISYYESLNFPPPNLN